MTRRWAPQTRNMLRRNTASIMKDLIWDLNIAIIAKAILPHFVHHKNKKNVLVSKVNQLKAWKTECSTNFYRFLEKPQRLLLKANSANFIAISKSRGLRAVLGISSTVAEIRKFKACVLCAALKTQAIIQQRIAQLPLIAMHINYFLEHFFVKNKLWSYDSLSAIAMWCNCALLQLLKEGEASKTQKKSILKRIFTKFHLSMTYQFWNISFQNFKRSP